MEDTRTMLHAAMPALRKASSKLESRSRCFPTPFVRKIFFATNAMRGAEVRCLLKCARESRKNFSACEKVTRTQHCVNQFPGLASKECVDFASNAALDRAVSEMGVRAPLLMMHPKNAIEIAMPHKDRRCFTRLLSLAKLEE